MSVIAMNCGAEGSFGGTALPDALKNALYVAHSVSVTDVKNSGERFLIGENSFSAGKAHKSAFKSVVWNFLLCMEEFCEAVSAGKRFRLHGLRHTFIEPLRAASSRKLIHERMSKFVF